MDGASGVPRLIEVVQAFECGAIRTRSTCGNQVEGAIMMGAGPALREEILFEDGKLTNAPLRHLPGRFRDVPKLDVILAGPQGSRIGGGRRDSHHRHRAGDRQRGVRRDGGSGSARCPYPRSAGVVAWCGGAKSHSARALFGGRRSFQFLASQVAIGRARPARGAKRTLRRQQDEAVSRGRVLKRFWKCEINATVTEPPPIPKTSKHPRSHTLAAR